jgi:DNA-binding transcriptional ArsR family regulator
MADQLSLAFAALADPTRRAMLARLAEGRVSVSELAEPFLGSMSLPAVTKHVQVLERAGLVTKTREAQRRPCELNANGLRDIADWVEPYRAMWEETFDRLDEYLKTVTAKQPQLKQQEQTKHAPAKGTTTAKPQAKPKAKSAKPKRKTKTTKPKRKTKTTTTKAKPPEAARGDKKARGGKQDGCKK